MSLVWWTQFRRVPCTCIPLLTFPICSGPFRGFLTVWAPLPSSVLPQWRRSLKRCFSFWLPCHARRCSISTPSTNSGWAPGVFVPCPSILGQKQNGIFSPQSICLPSCNEEGSVPPILPSLSATALCGCHCIGSTTSAIHVANIVDTLLYQNVAQIVCSVTSPADSGQYLASQDVQ